MTGMLSLFGPDTTWITGSALTAAAVLSGWWVAVALRTVRDRDAVAPADELVEPRFR